ncbi:MAG: hypothetical protein ACC628_14200 [Pirellulaceae bacterium]
MTASRWMAVAVGIAAFVGLFSPSWAQRRPNLPKDKISSAGKIKAIGGGVMHVENVGGDEWLVRVEAEPQNIILTGSALPTFLRPGMFVQFKGLFTKRGIAQERITQLKVFSPQKSTKLGAVVQSAGPDTAKNNLGAFLVQAPKEEPDPEAVQTNWYSVTGVIKGHKLRKMTVNVGRSDLKIELAENAEIVLNINDYRIARVGDEVEFEGWNYPGQKQLVHATRLSIRADKPFGEAIKKKLPGTAGAKAAAKKKKKPAAKKKKPGKNNPFPL